MQEVCYVLCRPALSYEADDLKLAWGEIEAAQVVQEGGEDFVEIGFDKVNQTTDKGRRERRLGTEAAR